MARVVASELSDGSVKRAIYILENDIDDTSKLITSINDFINDSAITLKGTMYDAVRKKLRLYVELLNVRKKLASDVSVALSSSTTSLLEYMEGYTKLDDSILTEIENSMSDIYAKINSLEDTISTSDSTDKSLGNTYASSITAYRSMYAALSKEKNKIKGLSAADTRAYDVACGIDTFSGDDIFQEIVTYSSDVAQVKPTKIST